MFAERVNSLLAEIRQHDDARYQLVKALREMVLGLGKALSEEFKFGGIHFSAGQPAQVFCGLTSCAKHVELDFDHGAALADPFGHLEGTGPQRRHIKLASLDEVADKHVLDYLKLALQEASTKHHKPFKKHH